MVHHGVADKLIRCSNKAGDDANEDIIELYDNDLDNSVSTRDKHGQFGTLVFSFHGKTRKLTG